MEPQVIQAAAMEPNVRETEPIHVLFVEDEILISEWVAQSLSEQGFSVQTVTNAADALEHLAAVPVDVLFTDINLATWTARPLRVARAKCDRIFRSCTPLRVLRCSSRMRACRAQSSCRSRMNRRSSGACLRLRRRRLRRA